MHVSPYLISFLLVNKYKKEKEKEEAISFELRNLDILGHSVLTLVIHDSGCCFLFGPYRVHQLSN